MPFKSEKQRRYLFANEPELAKKWSNMYKNKIVGLGGVRKKPTLKKGDVVFMDYYVSKSDKYGNRYNGGKVFYLPKGSKVPKKLGESQPSWGGEDMALQNAYKILEENTFKPRGRKINFRSDYRMAGVIINQNVKEDMPIRKFNQMFK